MNRMFYNSKFNGYVSDWKVNDDCDVGHMFDRTTIKKEGRLPLFMLKK